MMSILKSHSRVIQITQKMYLIFYAAFCNSSWISAPLLGNFVSATADVDESNLNSGPFWKIWKFSQLNTTESETDPDGYVFHFFIIKKTNFFILTNHASYFTDGPKIAFQTTIFRQQTVSKSHDIATTIQSAQSEHN